VGKEIVLFKSEERKSIQGVAKFLHQLADKLAENKVILRRGTEEIQVSIPDNVILELKVEEEIKKGKTQKSLEIEIEWIEGDESGGVVTLG
jgi:amphi-Trp domain-containing protein